MAKKPYVSPIDTVRDQLYKLFSTYFSKGWISEAEIYSEHDMRSDGGLNFVQLRTLLRTECKRRGVPLVLIYGGHQSRDRDVEWGLNLMESRQTRDFLLTTMLMGNVRFFGLHGENNQIIAKRMQRLWIIGEETMDAVYAVLEQQPFIARSRAIGAEHYPPR